jgi:hypothetical protein
MALYDQRVFRVGDHWWVAEVHSGGGAGWGDNVPPITHETVTFTCISDENEPSRHATISPGILKIASHRRVRALLDGAASMGDRFEMSPVNPPWLDDPPPTEIHVDEERLRWSVKPARIVQRSTSGPHLRNALEIVCLDDSALHMILGLATSSTCDEVKNSAAFDIDEDLVRLVKSVFDDRPLVDVE